jgi:hypothetical protein
LRREAWTSGSGIKEGEAEEGLEEEVQLSKYASTKLKNESLAGGGKGVGGEG